MRETLRGVIGAIIIIVGLLGLVAGMYGVIWLQNAAEKVERDLVSGMDFGLESLEVVSDTLQVMIQAVEDTAAVIDSAVESSRQASETLREIQPAVQEMNDLAATDFPASIEAIQNAMPALEQAAATVDATMRTLAGFEWSTTIPVINYELGFGLGVEYDPSTPLDQSVAQIDQALGQLPSQLDSIQTSLNDTDQNLGETATTVEQIGDSLVMVSEDLAETATVLDQYNDLAGRATHKVREVRRGIRQRVQGVRLGLSVLLVWLALSQVAPLYLGCTLVTSLQQPEIDTLEVELETDQDGGDSEDQGPQARPPAEG